MLKKNKQDQLEFDPRDSKNWPEPETDEPDEDTIQSWILGDGDCEATDGCVVEPDGHCPHLHPSWLIRLGLI